MVDLYIRRSWFSACARRGVVSLPSVRSVRGGLCDDAAFEGDPAAVYGKLVDMGATMIQTDRPELLISYLRARGLHD